MKELNLKRYFAGAVVFAFAVAAMQACYYDNAEDLYPKADGTCPDTISFAVSVEPIVAANCALPGCHVPGTGRVPLTGYAEIEAAVNNNDLRLRVESGSMPPSGGLPADEIESVSCWIEQGAQNN